MTEDYDATVRYPLPRPPEWVRPLDQAAELHECPACHGEGMVPHVHNPGGDDPEDPCEVCDGSGSVLIDARIAAYIERLQRRIRYLRLWRIDTPEACDRPAEKGRQND